jgi:hypothetical protein
MIELRRLRGHHQGRRVAPDPARTDGRRRSATKRRVMSDPGGSGPTRGSNPRWVRSVPTGNRVPEIGGISRCVRYCCAERIAVPSRTSTRWIEGSRPRRPASACAELPPPASRSYFPSRIPPTRPASAQGSDDARPTPHAPRISPFARNSNRWCKPRPLPEHQYEVWLNWFPGAICHGNTAVRWKRWTRRCATPASPRERARPSVRSRELRPLGLAQYN